MKSSDLKDLIRTKASRLKVLSLDRCVYALVVFLLQFYLIVIGLKRLQQTIWLNEINAKIKSQSLVVFYVLIIVNSMVLTVMCLFCGLFRIGNYSHDGVEFGKHIDNKPNLTRGPNKSKLFKVWRQLPPICNLVHVASALSLLYADMVLSYVRIRCGLNPIGDVFKTKFDFLIGEPVDRIKNQNILKHTDDFSTTLQNSISIDLLNYMIALIMFTIQIAKNFWYTNKKFCLIVFYMGVNYSVIGLVSLYAFEIAYKIDIFAIKYQLYNNGYLSFIYFFSMFIKCVAIWLCATVGYEIYETSKHKFESSVLKILNKSQADGTQDATKSDAHMKWKFCNKNIFLVLLFLTYCIFRILYLIEIFLIFQNISDNYLLISFSVEILCVLFWLFLIVCLLTQSKWSFRLSLMYKLTNWKYYNDEISKKPEPFDKTLGKAKLESSENLYVRDDSLLNQSIDQSSDATTTSLINQRQNISVIAGNLHELKCYDDIYSKPKRSQFTVNTDQSIQKLEIKDEQIRSDQFAQRTLSQRLPKAISFDLTSKNPRLNYSSVCARPHKSHISNGLNELFLQRQSSDKSKVIVDSPTFSTTDSGRDSLNESPIDSKQLTKAFKSNNPTTGVKVCPIAKLDSHC
jgi:hypothetical protein